MDGFEHGAIVAEIGAGDNAETAYQACREIGNDVAIEVGQDENIEGLRPHHELHAGIINDQFAVFDTRKSRGGFTAAAQKQAVAHLHDVGLVDGDDFLSFLQGGVFEGRFRDFFRSDSGDDFQAFHHVGHYFVLDSGVEIFRIFAEDDHVDRKIGKTRFQPRKHANGAEIHKQIQAFAQRHVDAGMAAGDGRSDGAFQTDFGAAERLENRVGQVLSGRFFRLYSGVHTIPFNGNPSRFHRARRRVRYFGSNSITRDKRNCVSHVE